MRITLTSDDIHRDYKDRELPEKVDVYCFTDQAQAIVNAAGGAKFELPSGSIVDIAPEEPGVKDAVFVVVGTELTLEDRRAAVAAIYHSWTFPKGETPMTPEDVVHYRLSNAIGMRKRFDRSRLKWGTLKVYDKLPEDVEGHTSTKVFSQQGKLHQVMLPNGRMGRKHVHRPVEGTWACSTSPSSTCWYDDGDDPSWDFCLFCGNPDERK